MGFLDRLLGREPFQSQQPQADQVPGGHGQQPYGQPSPSPYGQPNAQASSPAYAPPGMSGTEISADEAENQRAIARYQYLLRTASPEDLERVHTEAFAKLTPEQRQQILTSMSTSLPAGEKVASAEPADLARAATRAEMQQPGYMNATFGQAPSGGNQGQGGPAMAGSGGMSMGKMIGGAMIGTIAGMAVTSAVSSMFNGFGHSPEGMAIGDSVDYPQEWAAEDAYAQGLADAQGGYDNASWDSGSGQGPDGGFDGGYDSGYVGEGDVFGSGGFFDGGDDWS